MKATLKIIGQIVLILLVAGVIVGAFYGAVQSKLISMPTRGEHIEGRNVQGQPGEPNFRGEGGFEGRERGGRGPDLFRGIFGLLGSLLKLTVIVVVILWVQNLFNRWQMRKNPAGA